VKFVGPLSIGGTAAQAILLQYVEGKPMADVGWGRASVQDIELLSEIHRAEFDLLARTPYIADRASTPIMQRVLDEFDAVDTARLTVLVGHDTNVANVGGMLGVHWHVPGYAADDPAVNGTLGFELLADASGAQFVRVFFQAQGTRQLRELQPLDVAHPPYLAYLPQPLCGLPHDRTLCTVEDFERTVREHLVL
jgi:4-phytase/acid phosphatase